MTEENNKEAQVYELGYHILSTVPADDLEKEVSVIRSAIEKRGGSFIAEGTPESVELAYPMYVNEGGKQTKYDRAYFGWFKFEMDAEQAVLLEKEDVATNKQILRHVLITTTREETRAQLQTEQNGILREVQTKGTLEKKSVAEESSGEVSEEAIDKSIDDLVGDDEEKN